LYLLEVFVVTGEVDALSPGIYKYISKEHALMHLADGDKRKELARAALSQNWIAQAPVVIVICAVYERVTDKYSQRGIQWAFHQKRLKRVSQLFGTNISPLIPISLKSVPVHF
jgi:SagB-type dehydrogenase family enzyme